MDKYIPVSHDENDGVPPLVNPFFLYERETVDRGSSVDDRDVRFPSGTKISRAG